MQAHLAKLQVLSHSLRWGCYSWVNTRKSVRFQSGLLDSLYRLDRVALQALQHEAAMQAHLTKLQLPELGRHA